MRQQVIDQLKMHFDRFGDFVEALPEGAMTYRLTEPSNTVGAQLGCVASGRDSYGRAIRQGKWAGWTWAISSEDTASEGTVATVLSSTAANASSIIDSAVWTDRTDRYLLGLLEHETMHQGQLLRYGYGLGIEFPKSWADRWGL